MRDHALESIVTEAVGWMTKQLGQLAEEFKRINGNYDDFTWPLSPPPEKLKDSFKVLAKLFDIYDINESYCALNKLDIKLKGTHPGYLLNSVDHLFLQAHLLSHMVADLKIVPTNKDDYRDIAKREAGCIYSAMLLTHLMLDIPTFTPTMVQEFLNSNRDVLHLSKVKNFDLPDKEVVEFGVEIFTNILVTPGNFK